MCQFSSVRVFALLAGFGGVAIAAPPEKSVVASVESTLATGGGNIRQFAFDGNPDTVFQSEKNATAKDHLTLILDPAVTVKSIRVSTGRGKEDKNLLGAGMLEISEDGKTFEKAATFEKGAAVAKPEGKKVRAIRVKPTEDLDYPLVVREFAIEGEPAVKPFKFPVEVAVNVDDAPEMKEWTERVARVCERQYPMLCEELWSDGFKPRTVLRLKMDKNYRGVAEAGGGNMRGSVTYFKDHPDDIGAFVHETAHCVQGYPGARNPGWLVEGVADYVRFFKYEANKPRKLKPEQAKYNGSYRTTAAFLAYVAEKHDKDVVKKLNAKMRAGEYGEQVWKDITGKTVAELGDDWKESLTESPKTAPKETPKAAPK
ncbi:basic secretory protein-like protein [Zavarzinella formosa]|uniref:basic secretory protein-like protein n=1 Tax=Zavarzinella formosa TaxID=360055 RepID=UPI0002EAE01B|nr:basic secretory protein-like protein [Zavarzinella formosa]